MSAQQAAGLAPPQMTEGLQSDLLEMPWKQRRQTREAGEK